MTDENAMAEADRRINMLKVELFDVIERQTQLSAEHQRLEQVKQNKLRALAMLRQGRRGAETSDPAPGGANGSAAAPICRDLAHRGESDDGTDAET